MATIVGDKLKLSNYSYLLSRDGTSFINAFQVTGNRTRQEKIIDAVDIDWRPFRFKNFAYVSTPGKATYTYVTNAGDLFDTERLIDWISYSYSMGYNLDFYGYIYHNKLLSNVKRPNILTNIGWIDKDSRIIGYTFWPAVGAQYRLTNNQDDWENIYYDSIGEIFNDYTRNAATGSYSHAEGSTTISSGNYSHAEGKSTTASGQSSHAEGESTQSQGKYSHAEGGSTLAYGDYAHAEGAATMAIGNYSHVEGIGNITTVSSIKPDGTREVIFNFPTEQPLVATEVGSHAEGIATQALQGGAHAEGVHTYSYGLGSHAEGALTYAKARYAHAEGLNAYAFGEASHAEGAYNRIYGDFSHIEGYENITYSTYSHIGGSNNLAYGKWNRVEGNSNKINSTNGHHNLVSGDNNTISNNSSYNVIHSKNVSITNTIQSLIIGAENTLNQSSNILGIGEQNSITSSEFISSLGTSNTTTNSNNILISGQGNTISNANYGTILGFENTVSGDDIFVSGVNNTNNKIHSVLIGNNLKNTQNTTDLGITVLGHYNTERAAYNFIIGDGTTNTNRHNALEITNNGWTYISALATYINNIVAYTAHKPIAYNTNFVSVYSFAGIERHAYTIPYYSNSYNLLTYSYILPTKQYVDKLLELKDAFRFAGTFTPTNTNISFAEEGTTHTVSGTWIPTTWFNNGETNTQTTTYDSSTAAVWRVTKRGWFGSYVVEGGDLLIAYADATRTSDENWAIIETHMNWVDNTAAYLINGTNGHRILSNFHLTDSGILTYTYTQLHHAYVSNQHNGFLTNLAVVNNGNNIQVSYVHTYFQNQNTNTASTKSLHNITDYTYSPENNDQNGTKTHSDFKNANDVDSITVVNNINMNADGKLTYAYLTVNKLRMHHNNIGYFTTTYNIDAGILNINGDYIDVIANVHLTDDGTLSYTRSHYTNIKTHHHTYSEYNNNGTNYRTGIKEVNTNIDSVLPANDQYKVISYAYINSTGTVYTYYYELQNVRHHHHTYSEYNNNGTDYRTGINEVNTNVDIVLPANDQYKVISYAYINSGGVAYTYYYTLSNLRHHHHTYNEFNNDGTNYRTGISEVNTDIDSVLPANDQYKVISYAYVNSGGVAYTYFYNLTNVRHHHHTYTPHHNDGTNYRTAVDEIDTNIDTVAKANDKYRVVSYAYVNSGGVAYTYYYNLSNLRHHHHLITGVNQGVGADWKGGDTKSINVITGVSLSETGTLAYSYHSLSDNYRDRLERNYTNSFKQPTSGDYWYRVAETLLSNSVSPSGLLMINRIYNSPQNEGYTFNITIGYNGDININQLTGTTGVQKIDKIRVAWKNSSICYIDIHVLGTGYENTIYVTTIGAFKTYKGGLNDGTANAIVSNPTTTGYTLYEFTPRHGSSLSSSIHSPNWFISSGSTGWRNETYGGGWYMTDSSWIKNYNNKPLHIEITENNGYGINGHRLAEVLRGNNHVSSLYHVNGANVAWGLCAHSNGNFYLGKRTNGSLTTTTNDVYKLVVSDNGLSINTAAASGKSNHGYDTQYGLDLLGHQRIASSISGAGGDAILDLYRGTNASWRFKNAGGDLYVQSNYTTAITNWFDVFKLHYNTGNGYLKGSLGIGTDSPAYKLDVVGSTRISDRLGVGTTPHATYRIDALGDIRAQGWLRTTGNTGWYSDTHGGGWYMKDGTYIRNYGSKRVQIEGISDYYGIWLNGSGLCAEGYGGAAWNNGHGAVNVGLTDNTSQTPLIVGYRTGQAFPTTPTTDALKANRLFAMEMLNNGNQMNMAFGAAAKFIFYKTGNLDAVGRIQATNFVSTVATGTQPYACTSTTRNTNLNADLLDDRHAGNADGNIPINNGTVNTNLNADMLDGYHLSQVFREVILTPQNLNADNLTTAWCCYRPNSDMNTWGTYTFTNFPTTRPDGGFTLLVLQEGNYKKQLYTRYNDNHIYVRTQYYSGGTKWSAWVTFAIRNNMTDTESINMTANKFIKSAVISGNNESITLTKTYDSIWGTI